MIQNTKFHRPKINNDIITRNRLSSIIENNVNKTATLVIAPTGYGKSILVSQWLESSSKYYCWLSIDDDLNAADSFFRHLLYGLSKKLPGIFNRYVSANINSDLPPEKVIADYITNEFCNVNEEFILVFDDYHLISDPQINRFVETLIHSPSPKVHLVLISRKKPDINISKQLSFGELKEIGVTDLIINNEELEVLSQSTHYRSIKPDVAQTILNYTEGWVIGVKMALLYCSNQNNSDTLEYKFELNKSHFKEYLLQETIAVLSKPVQKLMLVSAISTSFSLEFLKAILINEKTNYKPNDLKTHFLQLVTSSQFIISLDEYGNWYRYHHYYFDFLSELLKKTKTKVEIQGMHKKAGLFYEQNQNIDKAIQHGIEANDVKYVVGLFKKYKHSLLNKDQFTRLQKWLTLVPEQWQQNEPEILATRIFFHDSNADYVAMQKDSELFSQCTPYKKTLTGDKARWWAEVKVAHASLMYLTEQIDECIALSQDALNKLPSEASYVRDVAFFLKLLALQTKNQQSIAESEYKNVLNAIPFSDNDKRMRLFALKAMLNAFNGDIDGTRGFAKKCIALSKNSNLYVSKIYAHYFYQTASYLKNDLSEANISGIDLNKYIYMGRPIWGLNFLITKGFVLNALGKRSELKTVMNQLNEFASNYPQTPILSIVKAFETDVCLINNDIKMARKLSAEADFNPFPPYCFAFFPQLTQIKLWLYLRTNSKLQKAKKELDQLIDFGIRTNRINLLLAAKPLQALLFFLIGDHHKCMAAFIEALNFSYEKGVVRNFLDVGTQMQTLIENYIYHGFTHPYFEVVHNAFLQENINKRFAEKSLAKASFINPQSGKVKITMNEVNLLKMLHNNFQNKEIAQEIGITTDSVKKSLYRMYKKLGVNNRSDAIYKAIEVGLFKVDNT
ncbi:hypothetical protein KEM09_05135 [Carboxylicivirga mesophila]|uniref:HTH luxR-type domain-containing protein n=1 Tax=Carboxylicivirga mesophila TaxID=1166478 RepID=A0ABS5K707_9BACT|nr:LuxR C-terminal-related transcriptional regulator [Carboxylicivirga mesophila]MBS2210770.1 hypothetical protein [Carboxylicivirga mesophila]